MKSNMFFVMATGKKYSNYDDTKARYAINKLAGGNKIVIDKFIKSDPVIVYKSADHDKASKVQGLLISIGVDARVSSSEKKISLSDAQTKASVHDPIIPTKNVMNIQSNVFKADPVSDTTKMHPKYVAETQVKHDEEIVHRMNTVLDKAVGYIFGATRLLAIFPVLCIQKVTGKRMPRSTAYAILALLSFFGIYHYSIGQAFSYMYEAAYDFSVASFMSTATIFVIAATIKMVAGIIPGVSDIMGKVLDLLGNGLIALAAQTVILKIAQSGFLLKYVLSLGYGLGCFEITRRVGEKVVICVLLSYIVLPAVVSLEAFIYKQVTAPIIQDIKLENEKIGGVTGLIGSAVKGAFNKAKDWLLGEDESKKNEHFEMIEAFGKSMLRSLLYLLVSVLFLSIVSPYIAYKFLKNFLLHMATSKGEISLFEIHETGKWSLQLPSSSS